MCALTRECVHMCVCVELFSHWETHAATGYFSLRPSLVKSCSHKGHGHREWISQAWDVVPESSSLGLNGSLILSSFLFVSQVYPHAYFQLLLWPSSVFLRQADRMFLLAWTAAASCPWFVLSSIPQRLWLWEQVLGNGEHQTITSQNHWNEGRQIPGYLYVPGPE